MIHGAESQSVWWYPKYTTQNWQRNVMFWRTVPDAVGGDCVRWPQQYIALRLILDHVDALRPSEMIIVTSHHHFCGNNSTIFCWRWLIVGNDGQGEKYIQYPQISRDHWTVSGLYVMHRTYRLQAANCPKQWQKDTNEQIDYTWLLSMPQSYVCFSR